MHEVVGFRHCTGENIQVYNAYGRNSLEAVRNVVKGLRKIEKETGYAPSVSNITCTYEDDPALEPYCYSAIAYVYDGIA
jgi:hypothetical protein